MASFRTLKMNYWINFSYVSALLLVISAILVLSSAFPTRNERDVDGRRKSKVSLQIPMSAIQEQVQALQGEMGLHGKYTGLLGQRPPQEQISQGRIPLSDAELEQLVGRLKQG